MKGGTKILILAANPLDTQRLRLDEEIREIQEGLRRSSKRHLFTLEARLAVRPDDLRRGLLDVRPRIVHFCGHGAGEPGIVLEGESRAVTSCQVTSPALADLFTLCHRYVECVVLNACFTEPQARGISQSIRFVVGTRQGISDQAAIKFAVGFYDALGAGEPIDHAFGFGKSAIEVGLPAAAEHLTPLLLYNPAIPPPSSPQTPGVHRGGDTDFATLGKMCPPDVEALLKRYTAELAADADDPDTHFSLGLIYLRLNLYDLAEEQFQRTSELSPGCADAHFYIALALLRGRRPRSLMLDEIRTIERHINTARAYDERPAKYSLLLAIVRQDYYRGHGLKMPLPSDAELLAEACGRERDKAEIERMLSAVVVRDPALLATILC